MLIGRREFLLHCRQSNGYRAGTAAGNREHEAGGCPGTAAVQGNAPSLPCTFRPRGVSGRGRSRQRRTLRNGFRLALYSLISWTRSQRARWEDEHTSMNRSQTQTDTCVQVVGGYRSKWRRCSPSSPWWLHCPPTGSALPQHLAPPRT